MGLSNQSVGMNAIDSEFVIKKLNPSDKIIALAGNPNVGKSTVFNELTGLNQHTGNWPGKTVTNAQGLCTYDGKGYVLVDLPGCYSLMAHSAEEEVARDFICFGKPDAVIVVCDATCLERNFNLVLQILEITSNVVVCINLIDEAKKKKIDINTEILSQKLGVPVVATVARSNNGLDRLMENVSYILENPPEKYFKKVIYKDYIEDLVKDLTLCIEEFEQDKINSRWLALKLLDCDHGLRQNVDKYLETDILTNECIISGLDKLRQVMTEQKITAQDLQDGIVSGLVLTAEEICKDAVFYGNKAYKSSDIKADKWLTGKWTAFPIMFLALMAVFWLTITGANYPSELISNFLFWIENKLLEFFSFIGVPKLLTEMLVLGVYRVLAWVVSVMLPPMAIFFPLFTLLEDVGYLPRVAFNLDKYFKKCNACGKQALTMCMGFGCNAAGVIGCRIIDSPRERLIAIITNNFVPCNGRFPTLIAILTMFFVGGSATGFSSIFSALLLALVIVFGIFMTFVISKFLSTTILKGVPSSFTLELPPYRRPQIGKVILRSIFDRTLFVLGRAVSVAAPAGLIIWIMANITIGDLTLLSHFSNFLDPFAKIFGLDGVILLAFILGFPANEIVMPIVIMAYMAKGNILEIENLTVLKNLLVENGWTWTTAVSVMLFSLLHWPCSTTCLTIRKETQSLKWTAVSFIVPTITAFLICFIFNTIAIF